MRVVFKIEYITNDTESLRIVGDLNISLNSKDGVTWQAETDLDQQSQYIYQYEVCDSEGRTIREESYGAEHRVEYIDGVDMLEKCDSWEDGAILKPHRSSFFIDTIRRRKQHRTFDLAKHSTIIECYCERVEPHQQLAIVGGCREFGEWRLEQALVMSDSAFPYWRASVPSSASGVEYKFVILDGESVVWESGENRVVPQLYQGRSIVSTKTPQFNTPRWRGQGVAIPIFSLRTKNSWGVGEFADLRAMVDWSIERGLNVIQVLPINDTVMNWTWQDSYPYNANSTIALHPQYLAMREVGHLNDEAANRRYARQAKRLNELECIDYEAVIKLKMSYLREIYNQDFKETSKRTEYQEFVEKNEWWLQPYSLFSYLRDKHSTPIFSQWGKEAIYSDKLCTKYKKELKFYYFIQYHLDKQLTRSVEYARKHGVALKGDIPIGISPNSVDAYTSPELFNMKMQAGAPPDPFSNLGQNWGFPTYNWDKMSSDGYSWWKRRFQKMAEYFDAYRIDHILGFFRIWQVPVGSIHGLLGHFSPALPLSLEDLEQWGVGYEEWFVNPCITDELLAAQFNDKEIATIRKEYLKRAVDGVYSFKPKYDNQQKLQSADEELRERLTALHDEVLFVRDSVDPTRLHPRIMGADSHAFTRLSGEQQSAYISMHDNFYYQRHNEFWRDSAMQKLPVLISATNMLVCGEDLGMIPDSVAEVMNKLQILTLEIERMPKAMYVEFADVNNYPYLSVCTTSTHDMSTLRGWWREDVESTQRYYSGVLCKQGEVNDDCNPAITKQIINRHLNAPSMLTILPWQDWMALNGELRREDVDAERINVPANSRHYWRYRMHIKL